MDNQSQPLTIYTFAEAFKIKKELYHWDKIVFPRPILLSAAVFFLSWEIAFAILTVSGTIPLLSGNVLNVVHLPTVDFLGRFFAIPIGVVYLIYKVPAQGRSFIRFVASKVARWFRPSETRMGVPVQHQIITTYQLTEIEKTAHIAPSGYDFEEERKYDELHG